MTPLKPNQEHPLSAAIRELDKAKIARQRMRSAFPAPFEEFDDAWRVFLHRIERVYGKTHAACVRDPLWAPGKEYYSDLRRTDPLLLYVRQARNADEHTIQNVAREWDPKLKVQQLGKSLQATWQPWDRPLLPVTVRGVEYAPPRMHLGDSIDHLFGKNLEEPVVVSDLALKFYATFINNVNYHLFPSSKYKQFYESP